MGDRPTLPTDRERSAPGAGSSAPDGHVAAPGAVTPKSSPAPAARRAGAKFGAAADGWDAYNAWLDRVRQTSPPSRQAVIAKSLYSVSSYKSWADKARGAFDAGNGAAAATPATGGAKAK